MDTRMVMELLDIRALGTELRVATTHREAKELLNDKARQWGDAKLDTMELGWAIEDIETAHRAMLRACARIESVFKRQPKPLTPAEQAAEAEVRA